MGSTARSAPSSPVVHVAFLRGINVGTAKRVAMKDLKAAVEGQGYVGVRTALVSGNVVFVGRVDDPAGAASDIERAVLKRTGVASKTVVLAADDLRGALTEDPFVGAPCGPSRVLFAFCRDAAVLARLKPLRCDEPGGEGLVVGRKAAYLRCPDGVLKSRVVAAVGKLLGDAVTMRNRATAERVAALVAEAEAGGE